MDVFDLQRRLSALGHYAGRIDGDFGPKSRGALKAALRGSTVRVSDAAIAVVAKDLGLTPAHVGAVLDVESRGRGFDPVTALPIILFEPHQFHKRTGGKFSGRYSHISYPRQGMRPYPSAQVERWDQLCDAVALDPEAALASASWGLFQIMGFNHEACGHKTVWAFVQTVAADEDRQLALFGAFIRQKGLVDELKAKRWAAFARAYNGPSFEDNAYDRKLAAAYARRGGQ